MSLYKLRRQYEERRMLLIAELKGGDLDAARQHQVYGAIKEIDHLIKAIENLEEQEAQSIQFELSGVQPRRKGERRAAAAVKRWHEAVKLKAGNAVRATKRRFTLIRDVAREVKQRSNEQKE